MLQLAVLILVAASNDLGAIDGFGTKLRDRSQRDAVACAALKRNQVADGRGGAETWHDDEPCRVNHVIPTTGSNGTLAAASVTVAASNGATGISRRTNSSGTDSWRLGISTPRIQAC